MAKPKAIVVWFDDGTSYTIDPSKVKSIFINEGAAARAGRPGPHRMPTPQSPVRGPFNDTEAPTLDATTDDSGGNCFYVNGVIVCP